MNKKEDRSLCHVCNEKKNEVFEGLVCYLDGDQRELTVCQECYDKPFDSEITEILKRG